MTSRYRPLLPAQPGGERSNPEILEAGRRRRSVLVACSACQKAKSKCSGDRPTCYRCNKKSVPCEYDVGAHQTRASSRREAAEHLRELYAYLQERSWPDALEVLWRIRTTPDPVDVVRLIRAGDLLLHKNLPAGEGDAVVQPDLSSRCLSHSHLPNPISWTIIADDALVQTLISTFFETDQRFLISFIDKDMFLRDMQLNNQQPRKALFCSALLVNAICAITVYHCTFTTVSFGSKRDLGEAFFLESKRLLELEAGKSSLPTAQALLVMFSYSCCMGRDRAGNVFRAAGYEMMRRMMPKIKQILCNTAHPVDSRRAISKAVWGMFCFDSICSSVYLRPALFPAPDVPRWFVQLAEMEHVPSESNDGQSTGAHSDHETDDLALIIACDLSEIFNKTLDHIVRRSSSDESSTASLQLAELYSALQKLESKLPLEEEYKNDHHHENCHLWAYHHVVAANVARLLQRCNTEMTSSLDYPNDACIYHCQGITKHIDRYLSQYPSERHGSLAVIYFTYTCAIMLLDMFSTSATVMETFTRVCQIFREATEYPVSNLLLAGLAAVANRLGLRLPADTAPYFNELEDIGIGNGNIPLGFIVPVQGQQLEVLGDDDGWGLDTEEGRVELGYVLARSRELGSGN